MKPVRVLNMTRLFDKEMLIYSFFDVKLKKPARVVYILYFMLLLLVWSLPAFLLLPLNPYTLFIILGIPFMGASLMSKPIWGGKKFFSWLKTMFNYSLAPKIYYDTIAGKELQSVKIDSEIQISRRRDYEKLRQAEQRRINNNVRQK